MSKKYYLVYFYILIISISPQSGFQTKYFQYSFLKRKLQLYVVTGGNLKSMHAF